MVAHVFLNLFRTLTVVLVSEVDDVFVDNEAFMVISLISKIC